MDRMVFGVLMLAGVAGGLIITTVSPFSFGEEITTWRE
jgi:hypothetical protein